MAAKNGDAPAAPAKGDDPYAWLEEVEGAQALDWVRAQNAAAKAALTAEAGFAALEARLRGILDSKDRIPWIAQRGAHIYNFWQDEAHPKGLWRRTILDDYRRAAPAWDVVLDLDALAAAEGENWVWGGPVWRKPDYGRALIRLSRGGGDAVVVREFDLASRSFVAEGFALPEAKTNVAWRDADTLYVATDFGPDTLTSSGYARIVKEWRRGTKLAAAATLFEAARDDMAASPFVTHDRGFVYEGIVRSIGFYTHEYRLRRGGDWVRIDCPLDASLHTFADWLLLELRSDWAVGGTTHPAGALLAAKADAYLAGRRDFALLFAPGPR
ncbi:MAG: S9 family peptidase, partial [Rhodospirillaceae bacterium]|nr:S9 family peptidase [Rhodospirillaceae bacterium]